jgi:hypothetical protein
MQLQSLGQLPDHGNCGARLACFTLAHLAVPDVAFNVQLALAEIRPLYALNLAMPQTGECRHRECRRSRLWDQAQDRLDFR